MLNAQERVRRPGILLFRPGGGRSVRGVAECGVGDLDGMLGQFVVTEPLPPRNPIIGVNSHSGITPSTELDRGPHLPRGSRRAPKGSGRLLGASRSVPRGFLVGWLRYLGLGWYSSVLVDGVFEKRRAREPW